MPKVVVERKGRVAALLRVRYFRLMTLISLACVLCSAGLIAWRLFPDLYGKEVIPLHYNIHYGVDWTGTWWQIFVYPIAGALVMIWNLFLAFCVVKREPMLAEVVLVSNVVLTGFLLCATVFVVLMNIVYG